MQLLLVIRYGLRLLSRQWKQFVLPFLSLVCTATIVLVVILLTNSANTFLSDRNKELIGGEISLESNFPLTQAQENELFSGIVVQRKAEEFTFTSVIRCGNTSVPAQVQVVNSGYPLYGAITLEQGVYGYLPKNGVYIDGATRQKCASEAGGSIAIANTDFEVLGVVSRDPRQIIGGFGFLPKIILSQEGFVATGIDARLLRAEYNTYYDINDTGSDAVEAFAERASESGLRVSIAGVTRTGFIEGLLAVEQFLILTVLLVCILASVNVYTGVLYMVRTLRKSFAVLLTLGMSRVQLLSVVGTCVLLVIIVALVVGGSVGTAIFQYVLALANDRAGLVLPRDVSVLSYALTGLVILAVSIASFIPSTRSLLTLSPRALLAQGEDGSATHTLKTLSFIVLTTLAPLVLLAIFLLEDFWLGFFAIGILAGVYALCALLFYVGLRVLYRVRYRFSFLYRAVIAFKRSDGVFGIVSVTSLYIALTSLVILVLLQSSLVQFLNRDLGGTVPGVYVIDVQKSQVADITKEYPELTLFPNVGARILRIDDTDIQRALSTGDETVDRELGREYNLTYRSDLLASEKVEQGAWLSGVQNEVSVEKRFAERVGIRLGSRITFSVQGFAIDATVTSIRTTDSRSGLPFFFFVFNTRDLENYPATFFGYAYYDADTRAELTRFLGDRFPNVSLIETEAVARFVQDIVAGLTLIVFVIFIPPVILAALLIMTLIITAFTSRKKASAQLYVLGARAWFTKKLYYVEMLASSAVAVLLGYVTGMVVAYIIITFYLQLERVVWFTGSLIFILCGILILVILVAYILWKADKRSARELLSYEESY